MNCLCVAGYSHMQHLAFMVSRICQSIGHYFRASDIISCVLLIFLLCTKLVNIYYVSLLFVIHAYISWQTRAHVFNYRRTCLQLSAHMSTTIRAHVYNYPRACLQLSARMSTTIGVHVYNYPR